MTGTMKIPLGSHVRDTFTGFKGTATAYTMWMYGCNRYCIEAIKLDKDNKLVELWFDEQRVEIIQKGKEVSDKPSGGPQRDPVR